MAGGGHVELQEVLYFTIIITKVTERDKFVSPL
jgi:hypothetical protein